MRRFLKKRFRVSVLAILLLLMSSYAAYRVMLDPKLINRKAQRVLSEMLGVPVEVHGATFHPLSGLTIERVIVPVTHDGQRQVLADLHHLVVSHYLASVFTGSLNIREIRADSLSLHLSRDAAGAWNLQPILQTLQSRPPTRSILPAVRVNNLRLSYHDEKTLDQQGQPFDVQVLGVLAALTPQPGQRSLALELAVDDPDLGRWQVRGASIDVDTGELKLTAESTHLPINNALTERLGARGREILSAYGPPVGGDVKLNLYLTYQWTTPDPLWFRLEADLQGTDVTSVHFPYTFHDVQGHLIFTADGVHVERLTGVSDTAVLSVTGDVTGYNQNAGIELAATIDNLRLDEKLRSALLPERQRVYDQFSPSGLVDVAVRIHRDLGPGKNTDIAIDARNAKTASEPVCVTYAPFPYPLTLTGSGTYLNGHLRIDPEHPLVAVHDRNVFTISGTVDPGSPYGLIDLAFRGSDVALEPDLYAALPESSRLLWDYLQPRGKVDFALALTRRRPDVELTDIELSLNKIDALFTCRDFPYALQADAGSILYRRTASPEPLQSLLIKDLAGNHKDTRMKVNAQLSGFGDPRTPLLLDINVAANRLPLDDDLRKAVPESLHWMWDLLHPDPRGLVDAQCSIRRSDPSVGPLEYRLQFRPLDVSVQCEPFPYRVNNVVGQVDFFQPSTGPDAGVGQITFTRLRGKSDSGALVELNGSLKGLAKDKSPDLVDVTITGTNVPLDTSLRSALAPTYGKTFDALSPTGQVDILYQLKRDAAHDKEIQSRILVTALGNEVNYSAFPVPLKQVTGRLEILPDQLRLSGLSGKAFGGRVTLDGTINHPGPKSEYDLSFHAYNIVLDDTIPPLLPERYRSLFHRLDPTGRADVAMTIARSWTDAGQSSLRYKAALGLREASLLFDPPSDPAEPSPTPEPRRFTDVEGVFDLVGAISPDSDDLKGRLSLATLTLGKLPFTDLTLRFDRTRDRWEIYDLQAGFFGGRISGRVQIRQDSWTGFAAMLRLEDLDLARLGTDIFKMRAGQVAGKLSGKIELQGARPSLEDIVGRADLAVTEGKLWELPVILSLLNVLNIPTLDRTAFTDARADIQFYSRRFHIKRIDLLGNTVSIYGTGHIDTSGDMALTFLTGISRLAVPSIPIVADVVKAAQKQLMLVKVQGTVRDPRLEVQPIAPVTGTVKALLDDLFGPPDAVTPSKLKEPRRK